MIDLSCPVYGHTSSVRSVTFSPDNQWLVSGSYDNTIRFWTMGTSGNWRSQFIVLTNFAIYSLSYTTSNHLFLSTGGSDYSIRLWEQLSDKLILIWNYPHPNKLFPPQADLTAATLSSANYELLLQRGATGKPKIVELDDTIIEPSKPQKTLLFSQKLMSNIKSEK